MRPWTDDELDRLKLLAADGKTDTQISNLLQRTRICVQRKRQRLGIPSRQQAERWEPYEIEYLRETYPAGVPVSEITETLERSELAVRTRLYKLGITRETA